MPVVMSGVEAKEKIVERIRELIALSGLSVNSYASRIGVNPQTLYKCVGGRMPAVGLVQRILAVYPEVSPAWLLMGEGEMDRPDTRLLEEQLRVKDEQIRSLIEKIK